jgi:hypothetical protein
MSVLNWGSGEYNVLPGGQGDTRSYPQNVAALGDAGIAPEGPRCANPNGGVGGEGDCNMADIIRGEQ